MNRILLNLRDKKDYLEDSDNIDTILKKEGK